VTIFYLYRVTLWRCFTCRDCHCDDVLPVESASLAKLLQSLTSSQVVVAVSHDDMQTQLVDLVFIDGRACVPIGHLHTTVKW